MTEAFGLWCLVQGHDFKRSSFRVWVEATDSIAHMIEAILRAKPLLKGTDAHALVVWKIDFPMDDTSEKPIDDVELKLGQELSPSAFVCELWPQRPNRGTLSVLVKRPHPCIEPPCLRVPKRDITAELCNRWLTAHQPLPSSPEELECYLSKPLTNRQKVPISNRYLDLLASYTNMVFTKQYLRLLFRVTAVEEVDMPTVITLVTTSHSRIADLSTANLIYRNGRVKHIVRMIKLCPILRSLCERIPRENRYLYVKRPRAVNFGQWLKGRGKDQYRRTSIVPCAITIPPRRPAVIVRILARPTVGVRIPLRFG